MSKHTPGPWYVEEGANGDVLVTSTHRPNGLDEDICHVYGGNDGDKAQALIDAAAIATLPDLIRERDDLLDALQGMITAFDADLHDLMIAKLVAMAAITQATGGGK